MDSFAHAQPELKRCSSLASILIVEDDEDTRDMLKTCIELETSYSVVALANADETLKYFQETPEVRPCLFIFDFYLPTITGLQLYDFLHISKDFEHIPAIIITAGTLNLELDRAIAERNLKLLLKPFDIYELIDCVKRMLIGPGQLI